MRARHFFVARVHQTSPHGKLYLYGSATGNSAGTLSKIHTLSFVQYAGEQDLPMVMELIDNELSEPYSIFTYRSYYLACFIPFHNCK